MRFIDEKSESEARISRAQLQQMVHYAETRECRRATLLKYFGEEYPGKSESPAGRDSRYSDLATVATIVCNRAKRSTELCTLKNSFLVSIASMPGMDLDSDWDISSMCLAAQTRKRSGNAVTTRCPLRHWQRIEARRMAGNRSRTAAFGTRRMRAGQVRHVVANRRWAGGVAEADTYCFTKQIDIAEKGVRRKAGAIECDETLFERLRDLRRKLADERNVPAYVIFSDVSLREMARTYPTNPNEFRRIPGVGERKLRDFAEPFLSEIKSHLDSKPAPNIL